jgi:hypothetical protein
VTDDLQSIFGPRSPREAWNKDRKLPRAIARSLARHGYLRRPTLGVGSIGAVGGASGTGRREWLHFCAGTADVDLIVNLSAVDDLRPAGGGERVRLTVLVRTGDHWDGDVDDIDADLAGGRFEARFPGGEIALRGGALQIAATLRARPVAFDLALTPRAFPSLASNVTLGAGQTIHWLVVPRAVADGWIRVADRVYPVTAAPAYHDHNWGDFTHQHFAWQWGHAVPDDPREPLSVVLTRLLDRTQAISYLQALLVWHGPRQHRVFRGAELDVAPVCWLRPRRCLTVPRIGGLLAGGTATEVPERLHLHASGDGDRLDGEFIAHDVARIAVPSDHDLGTTLIHEVVGRLQLTGAIRGEPVAIDARAVFELLGSVP